jgi:phosphomethylpyrimidine synthase
VPKDIQEDQSMTQLEQAKSGKITPQMRTVAEIESVDVESLRTHIAEGLVVIPANVNHDELKPVGIGKGLTTKVNANIGTSPSRCNLDAEMRKLEVALAAGADAIMDLSIGGDIDSVRKEVIGKCNRPLGTVPIYQTALESGSPEDMDIEAFLRVFEKHARDGVDFATIHAGVTRGALPLLAERHMGVVSRGGSFMIKWMRVNKAESFLYEHYDRILDIAREYDVTMSLGDGLRPGCIDDATDRAQLHELSVLGELTGRARSKGVQVMVEGPGHVPIGQIEENVKLQKEYCSNAPFYVLGPLPTDCAAGYDHIAGAIGGAIAAAAGADFLCYLTPKEHLGLPDSDDVREGVIVTRIAAHVGDIEKNAGGAREQDRAMSAARTERDWARMEQLSIDPERFSRLVREEERSDQCSMCGEYCALKVYRSDFEA